MSTDRSWAPPAWSARLATGSPQPLKRVSKRRQIDATLSRNGRWEITIPGEKARTIRLTGRIHTNEVTSSFEPAEDAA